MSTRPQLPDEGETDWIREQFAPGFVGTACELGAHDGVHRSTTLGLERDGWRVLCIEPNPRWWRALMENRRLVLPVAAAGKNSIETLLENPEADLLDRWSTIEPPAVVEEQWGQWTVACPRVMAWTLDRALDSVGFSRLDVLSLDVDGIEGDILTGLDFARWNVRAAVIEDVGKRHPAALRGRDRDSGIPEIMAKNGFRLAHRIAYNSCYVREG